MEETTGAKGTTRFYTATSSESRENQPASDWYGRWEIRLVAINSKPRAEKTGFSSVALFLSDDHGEGKQIVLIGGSYPKATARAAQSEPSEGEHGWRGSRLAVRLASGARMEVNKGIGRRGGGGETNGSAGFSAHAR
jgi:hypothetical protein